MSTDVVEIDKARQTMAWLDDADLRPVIEAVKPYLANRAEFAFWLRLRLAQFMCDVPEDEVDAIIVAFAVLASQGCSRG